MRACFRPREAHRVRATYAFTIGEEVFHFRVAGGEAQAAQGPAPSPDLAVHTRPETFLELLSGGLSPKRALASKRVRLDGDPAELERALAMFRFPADEASTA
jgi:putative sterol carrier protein